MREILYLSERKLHAMFVDAGRYPQLRPKAVDATVGPPGVSAKVTFSAGNTVTPTNAETAAKLEKVIRYLEQSYRAADFRTPGLKPNQWVSFDLDMRYGTGHEDCALPGADDVVLFGGTAEPEGGGTERRTGLLLCGSTVHLRDRIASSGRMGSGTRWLYDVIKKIEERDRAGIHVVPEFLSSLVPWRRQVLEPESVVQDAFGALLRASHPSPDAGRLTGLARVLLDIDGTDYVDRLVLATPLYVEMPPPIKAKKGLLHLARRRRHDR